MCEGREGGAGGEDVVVGEKGRGGEVLMVLLFHISYFPFTYLTHLLSLSLSLSLFCMLPSGEGDAKASLGLGDGSVGVSQGHDGTMMMPSMPQA